MTGIAPANTMLYCPKCQKTFEESSRRFCDNDGGRLLPTPNAPQSPNKNSGVFTNLIGKSPSKQSQDEKLAAMPRFSPSDFAPIDKTPKKYDDEPEIELELYPRTEPEKNSAPLNFDQKFPPLKRETAAAPPEPELKSMIAPEPKSPPTSVSKPVLPLPRVIKQSEVASGTAEIGNRRTNPTGRSALTGNNPNVLLGQTIKGRYYIVEIFSQDESGVEYLAEDKLSSPPKKYLVKILTEQHLKDDLLENIYAEERISLSHIIHPNIVRVVDSGELHEGFRFLVTEFDEGDSVADLLKTSGRFNAMRTARIIRQASYAVSEIHESGILHRNLKPSNLLLNVNEAGVEHVKINGFGVSDGQSVELNAVFQAPEVIEGKLTTFASDIYSLAAIAYQMLTNQPPFEGNGSREMLRLKQEDLRVYPSSLRPDLSPSVDGILEKAMAYNPTARYAKTRDFGDAFFNAVATAAEWNEAMTEQVGKTAETILTAEEPKIPTIFAEAETNREFPAFDVGKPESDGQNIFAAPVVADVSFKPQFAEPKADAEIPAADQKTGKEQSDDPAWARRSQEPPKTVSLTGMILSIIGLGVLLLSTWAIWKYAAAHQSVIDAENQQINQAQESQPAPVLEPTPLSSAPLPLDIEVPPNPRQIEQPPNTIYFQNGKQSVKGDLVRNFLGFSLYYPKDWKLNEAKEIEKAGTRGKFLDLSKKSADGNLVEQMLISYYESKGTFKDDTPKFPQLVKETNETLKKLPIPNYQVLSEGETNVNGWKAYEVKFQGGGTTGNGAKLIVWGRRLFIPQVRAGAGSGYEITMLATSEAENVTGVDDVGSKDELSQILETFEPNQSY